MFNGKSRYIYFF